MLFKMKYVERFGFWIKLLKEYNYYFQLVDV